MHFWHGKSIQNQRYLLPTTIISGIASWVSTNGLSHINDNILMGLEAMRNLTFFCKKTGRDFM